MNLIKMMRRGLDIQINHSMFWTDSTAVLKYIKNENKDFQVFVANRLAVIHDGTQQTQWSYIESSSNPGDDTSRGLLGTSQEHKMDPWTSISMARYSTVAKGRVNCR